MKPPASNRATREVVAGLTVGRPVDVSPWDADAEGAGRLVAQVDFHRLGFQLSEAVGSDYRRRRPVAPGALVIAEFVRMAAVRRAFLRPLTDAALELVARSLHDAAVPWVVVKGPALLAYGAPDESRDYRDLDVLVSGADLRPAVAALEDAGAVVLDRDFGVLERIVSGELSIGLPNGVVLDLHWHPFHSAFVRRAFTRDSDGLVARSGLHYPDRLPHPVLDPHDNLVYVATHAGLSGSYRLLWVRDVVNALRHTAWDAGVVERRARTEGVALVMAVVLDEVAAVTGERSAADLAGRLAPRSTWRTVMRLARSAEPWSRGKRPTWAMSRSTRTSTAASVAELITSTRSRWQRRDDERNPWRTDASVNDRIDRDRYFRAVERESSALER